MIDNDKTLHIYFSSAILKIISESKLYKCAVNQLLAQPHNSGLQSQGFLSIPSKEEIYK